MTIRRPIRFALLIFAGFPLSVPALAATDNKADPMADPFYEASYCQYTATAFKDKETAQGWKEIAADLAIRRGLVESGDQLDKLDDMAFDLAPLAPSDKDRPRYEQCKQRLAILRQKANAARTAPSPVNTYAPARIAWYDRSSAAIQTDPAKRTDAMNKIRAWDAYCLMSGSSLSTMMTHNPAAFGLNLGKPGHAKLLQAVKDETAKFKSQYEKNFKDAERSQMQVFVDQQRDNYGKGYFARRDNEKAVVEYAKKQVFECSEGSEQAWTNMTR